MNMLQALSLVLMEHTFSYVKIAGERLWLEWLVYIAPKARGYIVFILVIVPNMARKASNKDLEKEVLNIKAKYPDALYIGIADGAVDNWNFLRKHTKLQLLDYYHVTEYLQKVATAAFPQRSGKAKRQEWMSKRCSELKHDSGTVESLIIEMEKLARKTSLPKVVKADLLKALTYFKNHRNMMNYPMHLEQNLPIGSGDIGDCRGCL